MPCISHNDLDNILYVLKEFLKALDVDLKPCHLYSVPQLIALPLGK